jgi:hypothetical protein
MYGAKFYDKPRDPLNVSDIAGASPTVQHRARLNDPRAAEAPISVRAATSPRTAFSARTRAVRAASLAHIHNHRLIPFPATHARAHA